MVFFYQLAAPGEIDKMVDELIRLEQEESEDWETPCPVQEDGKHCNCWYDGEVCCSCGET